MDSTLAHRWVLGETDLRVIVIECECEVVLSPSHWLSSRDMASRVVCPV